MTDQPIIRDIPPKMRSSQSDSLPRMNPTERMGKLDDAKQCFAKEDLQKKYGQLIQDRVQVDHTGFYGIYTTDVEIFKPSRQYDQYIQFPRKAQLNEEHPQSISSDGTKHYKQGDLVESEGYRVFLPRRFVIEREAKHLFTQMGTDNQYGKLLYGKVYASDRGAYASYEETGIEIYKPYEQESQELIPHGSQAQRQEETFPRRASTGPLFSESKTDDGTITREFTNGGQEMRYPDGIRVYIPPKERTASTRTETPKRWYQLASDHILDSIQDRFKVEEQIEGQETIYDLVETVKDAKAGKIVNSDPDTVLKTLVDRLSSIDEMTVIMWKHNLERSKPQS